MRLSALAIAVARRELDDPDLAYTDDVVEAVHRSLYHAHVPKLEEADVIEHDRTFDAVVLTTGDDVLEQLLVDDSVTA